MKNLILLLLVFYSFFAKSGDVTIDSTKIVLPKLKLIVKEKTTSLKKIKLPSNKIVRLKMDEDSVIAFQRNNHSMNLITGKDSLFQLYNLTIPLSLNNGNSKVSYFFRLDSLGTNQPYLIINWFYKNENTHSTYSGNDELICSQTVYQQTERTKGITVISLISEEILFQGISEVSIEQTEKKYPGNKIGKTSKSEKRLVQLRNNSAYLQFFRSSKSNTFLYHNQSFPYGFYSICNNQFQLVLAR